MSERKVFSMAVIERFLNEKEVEEFIGKYESSLKPNKTAKPANEEDFKILGEHLAGKRMRALARDHGVSLSCIYTSLRKAALAKLN